MYKSGLDRLFPWLLKLEEVMEMILIMQINLKSVISIAFILWWAQKYQENILLVFENFSEFRIFYGSGCQYFLHTPKYELFRVQNPLDSFKMKTKHLVRNVNWLQMGLCFISLCCTSLAKASVPIITNQAVSDSSAMISTAAWIVYHSCCQSSFVQIGDSSSHSKRLLEMALIEQA